MLTVTQRGLLDELPDERMDSMKSVFLNYTSSRYEYYVSEEDYRNVIRPLIMKLRVCSVCEQYYDMDATPPRPCVGNRICMVCFLQEHNDMRFLEVKSVNDDGEVTYAFIDNEGQVYTSTENYSDDPSKDISYTLSQHQFSLPVSHKPFKATEEILLHTSHFTVYGELQTASVLVADYNNYYDKHHCTFLLYKNGGYKELTKRGEGRVLIERATAMLERTKLPNGYYKIDGREVSRISDSDIYKIVSQMESAMYDISLQFGLPIVQQQPDTEAEEIKEPQLEEDRPRRGRRPRLSIVPSQETTSEDEETTIQEEQEVLPDTQESAVVEPETVEEQPAQEIEAEAVTNE